MKIWVSIFITALGFILGAVLAGVGGTSADPIRPLNTEAEEPKILEKYWQETGLNLVDVERIITTENCYSSTKYFKACLSSIINTGPIYGLKFSVKEVGFINLNGTENFDEKTEKELMEFYLTQLAAADQQINFTDLIEQLFNIEKNEKKSLLAAELINAFISIYEDPHSYILPSHYYSEVASKMERSKFFVGIAYEKNQGDFYIKKVVTNSDAEFAGLKIKDKLIAINSVKLKGLKYQNISELLRNEKAKEFKFVIERNNRIQEIVVSRSYRQLKQVQYKSLGIDKNYKLIILNKFNPGVCADIAKSLKNLSHENLAGVILDLRDNPGGQLNEAACITGLFLGKDKKAYYVEYFDEDKPNEVVLTSEDRIYNGPLVVLVNSGSASASELLAGSLQEYQRALIIGERTFGKGTFQEAEVWKPNHKVNFYKTQGYYLLPSRNSTQIVGVKPDIELKTDFIIEKSELKSYYNPIKANAKKYPQFSTVEKFKKISPLRCQKNENLVYEDLYLQTSLNYINCLHTHESAVAGRKTQNQIN